MSDGDLPLKRPASLPPVTAPPTTDRVGATLVAVRHWRHGAANNGKIQRAKKYSLATSNNSSKMSIVERVHGTLSSSPTAPWCPARPSAQAATSLRSTLAHSHVLPLLKYERRLPCPPQMLSPSCACIHRGRSQRLSHVQWRRTQGLKTLEPISQFDSRTLHSINNSAPEARNPKPDGALRQKSWQKGANAGGDLNCREIRTPAKVVGKTGKVW